MKMSQLWEARSVCSRLRRPAVALALLCLMFDVAANLGLQLSTIPLFANAQDSDCDLSAFPSHAFASQSDRTKVYMRIDRIADSFFNAAGLTKFTSVFGVRVLGEELVEDAKILYVATLLAELLDCEQNGKPSNPALMDTLFDRRAMLGLTSSEDRISVILNSLPKHYSCTFFLVLECQDRVRPGSHPEFDCKDTPVNLLNKYADRSPGLVADFVIQCGYPVTYPPNTVLGKQLEEAFVKAKNENWFLPEVMTSEDECDEHCLRASFQSYAISSLWNVDTCTCREHGAWKLCTRQEMLNGDAQLFSALTDDIKSLTGYYNSPAIVGRH